MKRMLATMRRLICGIEDELEIVRMTMRMMRRVKTCSMTV